MSTAEIWRQQTRKNGLHGGPVSAFSPGKFYETSSPEQNPEACVDILATRGQWTVSADSLIPDCVTPEELENLPLDSIDACFDSYPSTIRSEESIKKSKRWKNKRKVKDADFFNVAMTNLLGNDAQNQTAPGVSVSRSASSRQSTHTNRSRNSFSSKPRGTPVADPQYEVCERRVEFSDVRFVATHIYKRKSAKKSFMKAKKPKRCRIKISPNLKMCPTRPFLKSIVAGIGKSRTKPNIPEVETPVKAPTAMQVMKRENLNPLFDDDFDKVSMISSDLQVAPESTSSFTDTPDLDFDLFIGSSSYLDNYPKPETSQEQENFQKKLRQLAYSDRASNSTNDTFKSRDVARITENQTDTPVYHPPKMLPKDMLFDFKSPATSQQHYNEYENFHNDDADADEGAACAATVHLTYADISWQPKIVAETKANFVVVVADDDTASDEVFLRSDESDVTLTNNSRSVCDKRRDSGTTRSDRASSLNQDGTDWIDVSLSLARETASAEHISRRYKCMAAELQQLVDRSIAFSEMLIQPMTSDLYDILQHLQQPDDDSSDDELTAAVRKLEALISGLVSDTTNTEIKTIKTYAAKFRAYPEPELLPGTEMQMAAVKKLRSMLSSKGIKDQNHLNIPALMDDRCTQTTTPSTHDVCVGTTGHLGDKDDVENAKKKTERDIRTPSAFREVKPGASDSISRYKQEMKSLKQLHCVIPEAATKYRTRQTKSECDLDDEKRRHRNFLDSKQMKADGGSNSVAKVEGVHARTASLPDGQHSLLDGQNSSDPNWPINIVNREGRVVRGQGRGKRNPSDKKRSSKSDSGLEISDRVYDQNTSSDDIVYGTVVTCGGGDQNNEFSDGQSIKSADDVFLTADEYQFPQDLGEYDETVYENHTKRKAKSASSSRSSSDSNSDLDGRMGHILSKVNTKWKEIEVKYGPATADSDAQNVSHSGDSSGSGRDNLILSPIQEECHSVMSTPRNVPATPRNVPATRQNLALPYSPQFPTSDDHVDVIPEADDHRRSRDDHDHVTGLRGMDAYIHELERGNEDMRNELERHSGNQTSDDNSIIYAQPKYNYFQMTFDDETLTSQDEEPQKYYDSAPSDADIHRARHQNSSSSEGRVSNRRLDDNSRLNDKQSHCNSEIRNNQSQRDLHILNQSQCNSDLRSTRLRFLIMGDEDPVPELQPRQRSDQDQSSNTTDESNTSSAHAAESGTSAADMFYQPNSNAAAATAALQYNKKRKVHRKHLLNANATQRPLNAERGCVSDFHASDSDTAHDARLRLALSKHESGEHRELYASNKQCSYDEPEDANTDKYYSHIRRPWLSGYVSAPISGYSTLPTSKQLAQRRSIPKSFDVANVADDAYDFRLSPRCRIVPTESSKRNALDVAAYSEKTHKMTYGVPGNSMVTFF